ncbi:MAG: hypothetical protein JOZ69_03880, partial [Myxococcales bacterium]|nr:hypothetical protein [Myxococcales bacterium]
MRPWFVFSLACAPLLLLPGCRAGPPAAERGPAGGAGDDEAAASSPSDEAGFVDVPPQAAGAPYPGRMFYVFEAADSDPAHKPLVVFFNGGPGYATSLGLLAYGTARATLDPTAAGGSPATSNPASWTSFANLLYVDERQAGFSYGLAPDAGPAGHGGTCTFSPQGDAADFVRAVLRFLDGHAALRDAPVVLVGLSYGGERASLVLDLLLWTARTATAVDGALAAEIQAHYDAVFPAHAGSPPPPELAATQFGHAVLIQPLLFNAYQYDVQATLQAMDPHVGQVPADRDPYDVLEAQGWADARNDSAAAAFADPGAAARLLATDPRAITGLGPAARASAFRVPAGASPGVALANSALR